MATGAEVTSVVGPRGSFTFEELRSDVLGLRRRVGAGSRVALSSTDGAVVAAALVALDGWASEVHLLGPGVGSEAAPSGLTQLRDADLGGGRSGTLAARGEQSTAASDRARTRWVVYTSGTTGAPKGIAHTLETLSRTAVRSERAGQLRWGLLYDPNRMAGLQVLVQALATQATIVAPDLAAPLGGRLRFLADHRVDALSATPTLWRLILQHRDVALPLTQITLGGEIADQRILDALSKRFRDARIVHVFASTETGAAFTVRDGREGFPLRYLDDPPGGVRLDLRDDVLHVHCPGVETAGADGFASTGDVVEIVGDRVLFRGRASGVVNVGGANVWPEQVERLLRTHPEVADAVVIAKANAMSGFLLVATVSPAEGVDCDGLGKRVRSWVRGRAPNTHVPAMVKVVPALDVSITGKVVR